MQNMKDSDMNALSNAHTSRGASPSDSAGFTSNVLPEANGSDTGVSSDCIPQADHHWFVLRVTYNRGAMANAIITDAGVRSYVPMHYVVKNEIGKKKRVLEPLLPNLVFVYATRSIVNNIVKRNGHDVSIIKYYLDKTRPLEPNGKHPPLTIPSESMESFIKATSTSNSHVRIVSPEQCNFKTGDRVRVIAGEFEGVIGRVARIAGQQRVVVEMSGLCMVATAYVPKAFIRNV